MCDEHALQVENYKVEYWSVPKPCCNGQLILAFAFALTVAFEQVLGES